MIDLQPYKDKLNHLKGQRELLIGQRDEVEKHIEILSYQLETATQARSIVQIVAENTQAKITYHISNLVSSALAAVFPTPYKFEMRFVQRRNKTEADLIFNKEGNESDDLMNSAGGGVVDIAGLALRVALWSLRKNRAVIIMDEPLRFLSADLQERASNMLKEISSKLGIQIIMVSHLKGMIAAADKVITIDKGAIIE